MTHRDRRKPELAIDLPAPARVDEATARQHDREARELRDAIDEATAPMEILGSEELKSRLR